LSNPIFDEWKTFEDYKLIITGIIGEEFQITIDYLDSSFNAINFTNPSEEDKLRLEFIFCLDKSFDEQSEEFKIHLTMFSFGQQDKIFHPNGIIRIKRIK